MARNESSRAPIIPPTMKTAKMVQAPTPPVAKSYHSANDAGPEKPPAPTVKVSPAAASVEVPEVVAEVESLSDDAG